MSEKMIEIDRFPRFEVYGFKVTDSEGMGVYIDKDSIYRFFPIEELKELVKELQKVIEYKTNETNT